MENTKKREENTQKATEYQETKEIEVRAWVDM